MKRLIVIFLSLIVDILFGVLLYSLFKPIATWYLNKIPALGIDLYNSVTPVAQLQEHFSFWFSGYKDIWFGGYPLMHDFPRFQYYLMIPFANSFGTITGIQIYIMLTLFLLIFFSYLLFYAIGRNKGLAFLLATGVLLSGNIYGSATWGGSLPYFATQFFFPLTILCLVNYFNSSSNRWFWVSVLFAGLGFLGHPLPVTAFTYPSALLLLLLHPKKGEQWSLKKRLENIFLYFTGVVFLAFILLFDFLHTLFNSVIRKISGASTSMGGGGVAPSTNTEITTFYKNQIATLYSSTNDILFLLLGIGVVIFLIVTLFKKQKKEFFIGVSFLSIVLYVIAHVSVNMLGYSFFPQGLYRAFWAFPIVLGALVASLWRPLFSSMPDKKILAAPIIIFYVVTTIGLSIGAYALASQQTNSLIESVYKKSDTSSAFPEILSLKIQSKEQEELKKHLIPSFINPSDKNKRLYASDATVSIWWNSLYNMPLARGYIDPPIGTDRRGSFFLLDMAIANDSLVRDLKFPEPMAKNYALFFIDWFGIYYFEGGHLSQAANAPPSSYINKPEYIDKKEETTTYGAILRNKTESDMLELRYDLPQKLVYYKFKDEITSPVVYGSNAPTILIFSDDYSYEHIWRAFAAENLNSRLVVPVHGGEFIDSLNEQELKKFDAILLYNYSYHNKSKAFKILTDFVKEGGKVFIDTGGEVKESNTTDLPEFFPIKTTQRSEITKEWNLEITPDTLTQGTDFTSFGPPVYNNNPWKFSYPRIESDVRSNAKVILKNHGKAVLVEQDIGLGKVLWSGINLPYYVNQNPLVEETKFFRNIISFLVDLKETEVVPLEVVWQNSEKITIQKANNTTRGIIVKEQLYNGWKVQERQPDTKNMKIYKTGPTYPGFMYIPIEELKDQQATLVLTYNGEPLFWFPSMVSFIALLIILELIVLNGKFISIKFHHLYHRTKKKIRSWWEKEDEV